MVSVTSFAGFLEIISAIFQADSIPPSVTAQNNNPIQPKVGHIANTDYTKIQHNPVPKLRKNIHEFIDYCTFKIEDTAVDWILKVKLAGKIPEAIEPWARSRFHQGLGIEKSKYFLTIRTFL